LSGSWNLPGSARSKGEENNTSLIKMGSFDYFEPGETPNIV